MRQLADVFTDLVAEGETVDKIMAGLGASQWAPRTPPPGWTITHQAAHMASVFHIAGLAGSDPEPYLAAPTGDLLARWRAERDAAAAALGALPPDQLVLRVSRQLPASVLACAP